MSDLIYRQDAIDAICKACSMEGDYHRCDGYPETSTWCEELIALRALPSVEPKKGQWEEKSVFEGEIQEWQSARCSVCDKYHTTPYLYYFDNFNYCPNCGALMEVKE